MDKDEKWQIFKQIESDIGNQADFFYGEASQKNEKKWYNVRLGGSQFQFGNFENRGGSLLFKNVWIKNKHQTPSK